MYTPNDSKDKIPKQHEFALLVESSPAVDTAATNIMHDMAAMMAVSVQLQETRIKESYDQPRQDSALSFTSDIKSKS